MERMVQWTVLTSVDSLGVHVALHAFEAMLQAFNEKRLENQTASRPNAWTVRREDVSSSTDFGTMDDIPDGWFDFQTTFKKYVMDSKPKDIFDSFPTNPMNRDHHLSGDDIPKWLDLKALKEDFWPHFKREKPDAVFRCTYTDDQGNEKEFRVFWEIDGSDKINDPNKLKLGTAMFDACEACRFINQSVPAFTVRVNLYACPNEIVKGYDIDRVDTCLSVYRHVFGDICTVVSRIISNVSTASYRSLSPVNAAEYESQHFFVWMPPIKRDVNVYDKWFEHKASPAKNNVFSKDATTKDSLFKVMFEAPSHEYETIDQKHKIYKITLRHAGEVDRKFSYVTLETMIKFLTTSLLQNEISDILNNYGMTSNNFYWLTMNPAEHNNITEHISHRFNQLPVHKHSQGYVYFDQLIFRMLEQLVLYQMNRMNMHAFRFGWNARDMTVIGQPGAKGMFARLRVILQADKSALLSRSDAKLFAFDSNLGFKEGSTRKSLNRMLCESMKDDLPELESRMQKWVRGFNVPNAELFLRTIRCNNMLALQELAQQYFAGDMKERVGKVLKQMPVCTESEMRFLFRHVLVTVYWMNWQEDPLPVGTKRRNKAAPDRKDAEAVAEIEVEAAGSESESEAADSEAGSEAEAVGSESESEAADSEAGSEAEAVGSESESEAAESEAAGSESAAARSKAGSAVGSKAVIDISEAKPPPADNDGGIDAIMREMDALFESVRLGDKDRLQKVDLGGDGVHAEA